MFTTGQVLTAAQMTSLQATAMGGGAASTKTASYSLLSTDAGTTVAMNAAGATTITVDTGLFAAGDTVFIQNVGAGVCTITAGTATVDTAGALALPQYDAGILYFTSASAAIFYDYIQVGAASPLTTKGDLYTFSTSDTRLGVGANGTVLTAASGEATGLQWAAPASTGLTPFVYAFRSTAINLTNETYVELVFNAESFDSDGCYNTSNGRFTPTTAGKYFVASNLIYTAGGIDRWGAGYTVIRKNGANISTAYTDNYDNYTMYTVTVSNNAIVECNGTTDYISTFTYSSITTGTMQVDTGSCMTIFKVG